MQQSETNTLAAALTTMMAGASALSTLANTDIIEVRNSAGALKGKITAQNLAAFAAGVLPFKVNGYIADVNEISTSMMMGIYNCNQSTLNTPNASIATVFRVYNANSGRGFDLWFPVSNSIRPHYRYILSNAPSAWFAF